MQIFKIKNIRITADVVRAWLKPNYPHRKTNAEEMCDICNIGLMDEDYNSVIWKNYPET